MILESLLAASAALNVYQFFRLRPINLTDLLEPQYTSHAEIARMLNQLPRTREQAELALPHGYNGYVPPGTLTAQEYQAYKLGLLVLDLPEPDCNPQVPDAIPFPEQPEFNSFAESAAADPVLGLPLSECVLRPWAAPEPLRADGACP